MLSKKYLIFIVKKKGDEKISMKEVSYEEFRDGILYDLEKYKEITKYLNAVIEGNTSMTLFNCSVLTNGEKLVIIENKEIVENVKEKIEKIKKLSIEDRVFPYNNAAMLLYEKKRDLYMDLDGKFNNSWEIIWDNDKEIQESEKWYETNHRKNEKS